MAPGVTGQEPESNQQASAVENDRYQAIGELGRGGWGVVQRAIDHQLEREVAVKRLGGSVKVSAEARQRFLHEAKITSQLQHPGIVPVHELGGGESDAGEAFYVMKLLEGDTLRHEIRLTHKRMRASGRLSAAQVHDAILPLLHRFIDVCHAIAYAHQRGIIHRDLKPANVMIGGFGETIVVDWGLAKQVDCSDTDSDEETFVTPVRDVADIERDLDRSSPLSNPGSRNSSVQTCQGSIIGTPAYMSPEQARGDADASLPQADLYSLGVILHEILVGQHPFKGLNVETVLQRVRDSQWQPPRSVNALVPRPLSAISCRAMEADPKRRYQSAQELADEVQRYIVGDAVQADHETVLDRVARWCRRHRTLATTSFAVVMVALVAAVCIAMVVHHAHGVEREARQAAQEAQSDAMQRLTQTREAADAWLIDLSGALQFYPGLQPIREKLIEDAIKEYQVLADSTRMDVSILANLQHADPLWRKQVELHQQRVLERIQCECRLGDLYRLAGQGEKAEQHYSAAHLDSTSLMDEALSASESFQHLVRCEQVNARIGNLLLNLKGASASTRSQYQSDASELENWLVANESNAGSKTWCKTASCLSRLTFAWANPSKASQALPGLETSLLWANKLYAQRGSDADGRWVQTVATLRAQRLADAGFFSESRSVWQELITHLQSLCDRYPDRIDYRQSLADARLQLAKVIDMSAMEGSHLHYQDAISDLHHSIQMVDADEFYIASLANAELGMGKSLAKQVETQAQAKKHLQQAIRLLSNMLQTEVSAGTLRQFCHAHVALIGLEPESSPERLALIDRAVLGFTMLADHGLASPADRLQHADLLVERLQTVGMGIDEASLASTREELRSCVRAVSERFANIFLWLMK